jgi:hypothetical protein
MPWRRMREWMYRSTFLDLGTSWRWVVSFMPQLLYARGKSPRYPLDRRLGKPHSWSGWRGEENSLPYQDLNCDLTVVQPVASRYTNCAILAPTEMLVGVVYSSLEVYRQIQSNSVIYLWLYSSLLCLGHFFSFFIFYTVGRTPWKGGQPVAKLLPAHRTTQTQNKRAQTSTPWVGFEPMIPVFEQVKTAHVLDRMATVIGRILWCHF